MAKTSAHMDARIERQRETLTWIAPNKVGKFSDRVLNLAANGQFAQAVAGYNASTRMEQTFDNKADADELAEILRGDANVRFASVTREGSRWNMNAERFDGPSTDELARIAADGNEGAFMALYARVLPKIERNAIDYGVLSTTDGPGAVFDEDDAHQRQVEILWGLLQDLDFTTSFVGKFNAEVREVFHEARRFSRSKSVPQNHDYALVESVVRAHAGDREAAAEDLAFNPERSRHISKEKFYALLSAMDASSYVEFDPAGTEDQVDPTQSDALASVESGFENVGLDEVWTTLSDREKEILTLRYGLDGQEEMTADEIADGLGLTKRRINQIISGTHKRIVSAVPAPAERNRPRPTARKHAPKTVEEIPVFPVHIRRIDDETPAQTVAERRANPQDGVRAPLRIRTGDHQISYRQPIPERVAIDVFRSNSE